jgi:uncharacterized small protein (DUF1192 family)
MTRGERWVKGVETAYAAAHRWQSEDAMAEDEELPIRRPRRLERLLLDTLGIEEMRAYIGELREEIARVEADIARKETHRSAADAFFRTDPAKTV